MGGMAGRHQSWLVFSVCVALGLLCARWLHKPPPVTRRRQTAKATRGDDDMWSCVVARDPPRLMMLSVAGSGGDLIGALASSLGHDNDFKYVRSLQGDAQRLQQDPHFESLLVAAIELNSFSAASLVPEVQAVAEQTGLTFEEVAHRLEAVGVAGQSSSVALVYDDVLPVIDFSKHGVSQPPYIATIRQPFRQFAAAYLQRRADPLIDTSSCPAARHSLEACLTAARLQKDGCSPEACGPFNAMTAALCGSGSDCSDLDSQPSLNAATRNLQYTVLAIVMPELPTTSLAMLERLLPVHFRSCSTHSRTLPLDMPDSAAVDGELAGLSAINERYLRWQLANDLALYDSALRLFTARANKCGFSMIL